MSQRQRINSTLRIVTILVIVAIALTSALVVPRSLRAAADSSHSAPVSIIGNWDLGGIWVGRYFQITAGNLALFGGSEMAGPVTDIETLTGSISNGAGVISGQWEDNQGRIFGQAWVVTSLVGTQMSGFVYEPASGNFNLGDAYYKTLAACQADTTPLLCRTFSAVKEPPVAPSIAVSINPVIPPGGLGVGSTLNVPVTVSSGNISFGSITLSTMTVTGGSVKISSVPTGTAGFALGNNQSRTFMYHVLGMAAGTAKLDISLVAQALGGPPLSASGTTSFPVTLHGLVITSAVQPSPVSLEVGTNGAIIPKTLTVRLRFANTTNSNLKNVRLLSLNPTPLDPTQQLDKIAFPKGTVPFFLPLIAAKSTLVKTFTLKVTGDGTYAINYLAIFDDKSKSGGNGRSAGRSGQFTVVTPLLFLTARNQESSVPGGTAWYVSGSVRNLSNFQTVCLLPLSGGFGGNASGLGPHQIGVAPVNGASPPMAGAIAPGKSLPFLMRVNTDAQGGSISLVHFQPRATKGIPGDSCNVVHTATRPLLASSLVASAPNSASFEVHVGASARPLTGPGVFDFFGVYAKGSSTAYGEALQEGLAFANEYLTLAALKNGVKAVAGADYPHRLAVALDSIDKTATLIATFWKYSPQGAKDALLAAIVNDFEAQTHVVWDGVQAQVQASASLWFDHIVQAWYSGDTNEILLALRGAGAAGHSLTTFAIEMAKFEMGVAVLKKGSTLTKSFVEFAGTGVTYARLADIPPGALLNLEEMTRLWGLSREDWQAYRTIAAEEDVIIGVRGRAPISVKNLDEGAVWKHEELKPKNVNEIDIKYLGFSAQDDGLVAFRTYTEAERTAMLKKIHSLPLTNEEKNVLLKRASVRFNEFTYFPKIEGLAQSGEINVGINYRDNGIDVETASLNRTFTLDREKIKGGGEYYRPRQENPKLDALAKSGGPLPHWCVEFAGKALCRVTGDMDGVYIAGVDGTSLTTAKRMAVYNKLIAAGWQHPETLTWLKDPETFYFSSKNSILSELTLGGQPMIEFGPDPNKQFATFLDLKNSTLLSPDLFYLNIIGGNSAR